MIIVSGRIQATAKEKKAYFTWTRLARILQQTHNQIYLLAYILTYMCTYVEHIYAHQIASLFKTATAANESHIQHVNKQHFDRFTSF